MEGRALAAALTLILAIWGASPALAKQTQPTDEQGALHNEPSHLPTLTSERYNEDWSKLADPANRTGRWTDGFKYIPLDSDGSTYLTTGIELRLRNENNSGLEWGGAPEPDLDYVWIRALPYADLHAGRLRVFVQPIAGYTIGMGSVASPVDRTRLDLLQLFAEYSVTVGDGSQIRVAAGRQLVGLGSERLVGTRYGPNTPRAFDGGRATVDRGSTSVSAFYLQPVAPGQSNFDDRRSRSQAIWGVYATRRLGENRQIGLEAYYLGYRNNRAIFQQGAGHEIRHTMGLHSAGRAGTVHWDAEAMVQFGRFSGAQIRAWSLSLKAGKAFPQVRFSPDLTIHADIVSGDHNAAKPGLQTFNPLFPKGKYFGELSPIGPYNIVDVQSSLSLDLGDNVELGMAAMAYWRQASGDGVYDIPGNLLRAGSPDEAGFIGKQAEISLSWQVTPELNFSGSASVFDPGKFLRETGMHQPIHMAAIETNFRF